MEQEKADNNINDNDKFNWFSKIVSLISKHGKSTVAYAVLIFFLVINIIFNPINIDKIIDKWDVKNEKEHQLGLEKRKQADILIPNLLEALRYKTHADRVMLFEFHNGGVNSSLLPFYHFSGTYESIDVGNDSVDYVIDQYQKQNTGIYNDLFTKLYKDRYIYTSDVCIAPNTTLVRKMKKNGVLSYYLCAIYGSKNELVGVLSITSNNTNTLDIEQLNRITPSVTHQISNLISGIN